MNCTFSLLPPSKIHKIKSLWEKLNKIHLNDSTYFKDHFESFTFEKRTEKFKTLPENNIRIDVISDENQAVGYCISTIEENRGEINSLFVEKPYRKYGYGSRLLQNGVNWLKESNCSEIGLTVAEGHESVFAFYEKHNFYPRKIYLQLKE